MAFSSASWEISIRVTLYPDCAKTWAIPLPMVPDPMTEMFFIFGWVLKSNPAVAGFENNQLILFFRHLNTGILRQGQTGGNLDGFDDAGRHRAP